MQMKSFVFALVISIGASAAVPVNSAMAEETVFAGVGKVATAWFDRHSEGVMQGAEENGVKSVYGAAPFASPKRQAEIIDRYVEKGVKALVVVPNDAKSLEPSFKTAKDKGVAVITHESPHQVNADFDVELLNNDKFGALMMDEFVKYSNNKKGKYAIFVGSLTVPAHNLWADAAIKQQKAKYPDLQFIDRLPVSENREVSGKTALALMKKHPDLVGIICMGSEGAPGVGKALKAKNIKDKLTVVGVTTPNDAKEYLKEGYIHEAMLWDPAQAARVQMYLAKMVLDGKKDDIKPGFSVPDFGEPTFDGNTLIFDKPLQITKENVDNYNF